MNQDCGKRDEIITYNLDVNDYAVKAQYHFEDIQNLFIPLLETIHKIQIEKKRRIFIFLAGPAGCGKSTLGLVLEQLAKDKKISMQCVGLDGFHYQQQYLIEHNLVSIKGHPMTFDLELLQKKLEEASLGDCYWPIYSRKVHNPVENGVLVNQDIILIEGNYLLLDKWSKIHKYSDYSIFISCTKDVVKQRLIDRKYKGGYTYEEACKHFENSDSKNVDIILANSIQANICFDYDGERYCIR